jgi:hypothetical protein
MIIDKGEILELFYSNFYELYEPPLVWKLYKIKYIILYGLKLKFVKNT